MFDKIKAKDNLGEVETNVTNIDVVPYWNKDFEHWKKYLFLMWDGITFFTFTIYKLKRLNGQSPTWRDRACHPYNWFIFVTFVTVAVYITISAVDMLGETTLQQLETNSFQSIELNVSETIQMFASVKLNENMLLPRYYALLEREKQKALN